VSKSDKKQRKLDKRLHEHIDNIVGTFPRESVYYLEQCLNMPAAIK